MEHFIVDLSVILVGAAALSYAAVLLKQPVILAYIVCGVLAGPWGFKFIERMELIDAISHLGIALLLFLAGLALPPQKLLKLFRESTLVTLGTSAISFLIGCTIAMAFGFAAIDAVCIGLALMFSSTILTVKLLPTTNLHHGKMGAACIGVLILQDLIAIGVLVFIRCLAGDDGVLLHFTLLNIKLAFFIIGLIFIEQFILRKILWRIERLHEAVFILGLAWCFGVALISNSLGLFYETGAFFAGVAMARHPIALYIYENFKPIRDFFLVLFFFTLGARLNIGILPEIFWPTAVLAIVFMRVKPWLFRKFFMMTGEVKEFSAEAGLRLGSFSEFSLLVVILASETGSISLQASQLVQWVTILSFVIFSYLVVMNYQTPIGTSERLNKE